MAEGIWSGTSITSWTKLIRAIDTDSVIVTVSETINPVLETIELSVTVIESDLLMELVTSLWMDSVIDVVLETLTDTSSTRLTLSETAEASLTLTVSVGINMLVFSDTVELSDTLRDGPCDTSLTLVFSVTVVVSDALMNSDGRSKLTNSVTVEPLLTLTKLLASTFMLSA